MYKFLRNALILVVSAFALSANAEPMAFSINTDSGNTDTEDSLYLIDLATGTGERKGKLASGIVGDVRRDTEGLAFINDTLWGIDDDSLTLFPISTKTGTISFAEQIKLLEFPSGGSNDFGMTFSCDNTLYVTSVTTKTLYQVEINEEGMNGTFKAVGSEGALGARISAIAAIGNPTKLFGLGNGQFQNGTTDSPNLYSINPDTGVAKLIGSLGNAVGAYNQGGMTFDSTGKLWAITDRRVINNSIENLPSQILSINTKTGEATVVSDTSKIGKSGEVGFESLAIASPSPCRIALGFETSEETVPTVPTLGLAGRALAILLLMLGGVTILRRRSD